MSMRNKQIIQRRIDLIRRELLQHRKEQALDGDLHYTDAPKYAAEWYGEVYNETMKGSLDMD
jgi:hypothetical protein